MTNLHIQEIKAFVPAKDFALSKQFYCDLGFTLASDDGGIAYFHYAQVSFLLQDFYLQPLAENFMLHLLVDDVEAWWQRIQESGVVTKYGVKLTTIETQPWRMRDFCLLDPSGVLWRIGQNINACNTETSLLKHLQSLEVELHHPGVLCSRERLEQLLHPDFHEVGRSGRPYTRETIVNYLSTLESLPAVVSETFNLAELAPDSALLTFRSAQVDQDKTLFNHTLRSSLWLKTKVGWQLRYHQGTAAAETW